MAEPTTTVKEYLIARLAEFGAAHLFAVQGDYSGPFLSAVDKDPAKRITRVGVTNEWVAGYAADAYARLRGTGAVCLTYGVGTFGVLNALAGSYVEELPVALSPIPPHEELNALLFAHGHAHMAAYLVPVDQHRAGTAWRNAWSRGRLRVDRKIAESLAERESTVACASCCNPTQLLTLSSTHVRTLVLPPVEVGRPPYAEEKPRYVAAIERRLRKPHTILHKTTPLGSRRLTRRGPGFFAPESS